MDFLEESNRECFPEVPTPYVLQMYWKKNHR